MINEQRVRELYGSYGHKIGTRLAEVAMEAVIRSAASAPLRAAMLRPEDVVAAADLDTVLMPKEEGTIPVARVDLGGAEITVRLDPTTGEVVTVYG